MIFKSFLGSALFTEDPPDNNASLIARHGQRRVFVATRTRLPSYDEAAILGSQLSERLAFPASVCCYIDSGFSRREINSSGYSFKTEQTFKRFTPQTAS